MIGSISCKGNIRLPLDGTAVFKKIHIILGKSEGGTELKPSRIQKSKTVWNRISMVCRLKGKHNVTTNVYPLWTAY